MGMRKKNKWEINREDEEEEEQEENKCSVGGPTKLPEKGGGQHQQRPGKEEPLVGRRQEGDNTINNRPVLIGGREWRSAA